MKSNDWRHKNVARYTPGNTKILYFFNCLLDGMHTSFQHLRLFSNTSKEEFANLPLYHYNKDNKKLFITPNKKFVDYFYGGKQWRKSNGF